MGEDHINRHPAVFSGIHRGAQKTQHFHGYLLVDFVVLCQQDAQSGKCFRQIGLVTGNDRRGAAFGQCECNEETGAISIFAFYLDITAHHGNQVFHNGHAKPGAMVDASGIEGRDPVEDYYKIREELRAYSQELAQRKEIVAAAKMDLPGGEVGYEWLKDELEPKEISVYPISAATGQGVKELISAISQALKTLPPVRHMEEEGVIEEWESMSSEQSFEIERGMDGVVEVNGSLIDTIFSRIDPEDPDSMRHFAKLLEDLGIIEALRNFGVRDGQEVRLNGEPFDFVD